MVNSFVVKTENTFWFEQDYTFSLLYLITGIFHVFWGCLFVDFKYSYVSLDPIFLS